MNKNLYTIEDLLEILSGLKGNSRIQIESSDANILHSIARQVFKGVALTDRQFELCKQKLVKYKDQYTALEYDFDNAIENLRLPLRQIDRTKSVTIIDDADLKIPRTVYEYYKNKWKWIKIKFPFRKKDIIAIKKIVEQISRNEYFHKPGSHEHFIRFTNLNCYHVSSALQNRNFSIDTIVLDCSQETKKILENPDDYQPKIVNNSFKNIPKITVEAIKSNVDDLNNDSLIALDRQIRFSYTMPDNNTESYSDLTNLVVHREKSSVYIDPEQYSLTEIANTLNSLNRFPLLIALDEENSFEQITQSYNAFKNIIENTQQSVLFRIDNTDTKNKELNNFVKDNSLNNWVDNNTKIVYIKKKKLPKILLTSDFVPVTMLTLTSYRMNKYVETYTKFNCDLIVNHDKQPSIFGNIF